MVGLRQVLVPLFTAVALAACAVPHAAPSTVTSEPPSELDPVELGWRKLTEPVPWQDVLPLATGTAWTYQIERADECKARGVKKEIEGVVTETVTGAWEATSGAYVFEVRAESQIYRQVITRTYYLVLIEDTLYQSIGSPLSVLQASGRGFEASALIRRSMEVGDTLGTHATAWRVMAREPVVWAGGEAQDCLRLQQQTSREIRTAWFCPGVGFVKRHTIHIGESVNEQWQTLVAMRVPTLR